MNLSNYRKQIVAILLSLFCLHVFIIDIDVVMLDEVNTNVFYNFFYELFLSIRTLDFRLIIVFTLMYFFFCKMKFVKTKLCKWSSLIFSIITIVGLCYSSVSSSIGILFCSFVQLYKFLILFFGYYIIYYSILSKLATIDIGNLKMRETKLEKIFNKHPILISSGILIIIFLPLVIFYYPGGSTGDTADSVYQFFHSDESWSIQSVKLIDENIYINKHHSVLFTVTLGMFLKLGNFIHSYNLGFFLFILLQLFLVISIFTFMIYYMKKIKIPFYLIAFSLVFICFSPLIIKYSLTAVKDTLSASFTLVYVIFLFQIVRDYDSVFKNKLRLLCFIVVMLLVMLLRNNGLFTIIFSFPFLFILYKKYWKKLLKVFFAILIIFGMYDNVLLPNLGVSNGSIREVLSIPFMQIARVAKYHSEDFSEEEINKINEVLDFDNVINNYDPNISDNVKNTYKYTATKQELVDLFKIWFKYLKRYPDVYIDSFLNSTYGYFYPAFIEDDSKIYFSNFLAYNVDFNMGHLKCFNTIRAVINYELQYVFYSPLFIVLNSVAILDFVLIFSFVYIFLKKKYKYLIPLVPLMAVLLVCLASPVNGCVRYILPIMFSLPIILSIDYLVWCESHSLKIKL